MPSAKTRLPIAVAAIASACLIGGVGIPQATADDNNGNVAVAPRANAAKDQSSSRSVKTGRPARGGRVPTTGSPSPSMPDMSSFWSQLSQIMTNSVANMFPINVGGVPSDPRYSNNFYPPR